MSPLIAGTPRSKVLKILCSWRSGGSSLCQGTNALFFQLRGSHYVSIGQTSMTNAADGNFPVFIRLFQLSSKH